MIYSPAFELFNYFYSYCDEKYNTYDYLPQKSENVPYPFVIVGNSQLVTSSNKYALNGDIVQTINVWNMADDRAITTDMVEDIFHRCLRFNGTEHFNMTFNTQRSDTQIITDESVQSVVLLHGILDLHFEIL